MAQEFNSQPPLEIYRPSQCHDITEGQLESAIEEKTDITEDNGINVYYQGIPHPKKGWPCIENTEAINIVKKITLFTFSSWWMLWSKKYIKRYLDLVSYVLDNPFKLFLTGHSTWYKEMYLTPSAKACKQLLDSFLWSLGYDTRLADVFALILELDDAYRYRLQDICSETSKEALLNNPQAEVNRLIKIYLQRDDANISNKMRIFTFLASKSLMIPKVRRAFLSALEQINFTKLQYDAHDRYWCLANSCYNHMGLNPEQKFLRMAFVHIAGAPPSTILSYERKKRN